jgi:hypothetical protein
VREVEKEVVILESTHPTTVDPSAMQVEGPSQPPRHVVPASQERVLKVIRKLEVQILCAQHNPVRFISIGRRRCTCTDSFFTTVDRLLRL